MRTTDSLSVTIRPNAGEEKGGEWWPKRKGNLQRAPLCFLSSVCQIRGKGGGGSGGEGEESTSE